MVVECVVVSRPTWLNGRSNAWTIVATVDYEAYLLTKNLYLPIYRCCPPTSLA